MDMTTVTNRRPIGGRSLDVLVWRGPDGRRPLVCAPRHTELGSPSRPFVGGGVGARPALGLVLPAGIRGSSRARGSLGRRLRGRRGRGSPITWARIASSRAEESGGGPHALACAALLPDRVLGVRGDRGRRARTTRTASTSSAGMADGEPGGVRRRARGPRGARRRSWRRRRGRDSAEPTSPDDLIAAMGGWCSPVDRAALTGEFAGLLIADGHDRAAERASGAGSTTTSRSSAPWGFDLDGITACPWRVWQGGRTGWCRSRTGEWLAEHVAGARAHLYPTSRAPVARRGVVRRRSWTTCWTCAKA